MEPPKADVVTNQVSVPDLKAHLSQWLARVRAGKVVEVTSHRQPIARLTGLGHSGSRSLNPLQAAIDAGVVSWHGEKPAFPPPISRRGRGKPISDIVIEDRG